MSIFFCFKSEKCQKADLCIKCLKIDANMSESASFVKRLNVRFFIYYLFLMQEWKMSEIADWMSGNLPMSKMSKIDVRMSENSLTRKMSEMDVKRSENWTICKNVGNGCKNVSFLEVSIVCHFYILIKWFSDIFHFCQIIFWHFPSWPNHFLTSFHDAWKAIFWHFCSLLES